MCKINYAMTKQEFEQCQEDMYAIYQLKDTEEARQLMFMDMDFLRKNDKTVDFDNYEMVYSAPLVNDKTLEGIYTMFNIQHPLDYRSHSVSVSDVIVFEKNGVIEAYFVDSIGFEKVTQEFWNMDCYAVSIADRFVSLHLCDEGIDYTIYDAGFKVLDGGIFEDPDLSIKEAFEDVLEEILGSPYLKGNVERDSEIIRIDFDELDQKVCDKRIVDTFKAKTDMYFKKIYGLDQKTLEEDVKGLIQCFIENKGLDVELVELALIGSRSRGYEKEGSDLDFVVEYTGKEREESFFDLLKESDFHIGDINLDINPIKADKTGNLADFLRRAEEYMEQKTTEVSPENIVRELCNIGYKARVEKVEKNGVDKIGIAISDDKCNLVPVIYTEQLTEDCLEEMVAAVSRIYEEWKETNTEIDMNKVLSKDYILEHVYVGLQRSSEQNLIKKENCPAESMEAYLYVEVIIQRSDSEEKGTIKLREANISNLGIDVECLWEAAEKNTFKENCVYKMGYLNIISNSDTHLGASAILDEKFLRMFARKHGVEKLIGFPSSIHEFILVTFKDDDNLKSVSDMVREVNADFVLPEEQLSDNAFLIDLSGDMVKWEVI